MRRALGKGLSQLIAEQSEPADSSLPVDAIEPNSRQPRTRFDDASLQELAASIRTHGVLQPLIVRPAANGKYELIAGERRLRAAKLAGLPTVPVTTRQADHRSSLAIALIENVQREDINAVEAARAYRRLMDEFDLTQEQVAETVGKSRVAIANTLRLLRLPFEILQAVEDGLISEGHARALLGFRGEAQQMAMLRQIMERDLSVREVERLAQPKEPKESQHSSMDPNDRALQDAISTRFGFPTKIQRTPNGGKLVIEFYGDDDLDRILDVLEIRM